MNNEKPSDTFRYLYHNIIEEFMSHICKEKPQYCVRSKVGNDDIQVAIWKNFEKYRGRALKKVSSQRLDRHKLASCICGAIVETRPLVEYKGTKICRNANELLAIYTGLSVVKYYMIYDFLHKKSLKEEKGFDAACYLKENFRMTLPSIDENICDAQDYEKNIANALYWSHCDCELINRECFRYDIWAYAKIFYHLEVYNKKYFDEVCDNYLKI